MLQSEGYGGYSSAAERLTVAQDVEGSIPSSRPNLNLLQINLINASIMSMVLYCVPNPAREHDYTPAL
jgi:hypothetical protein